MVRVLSVPFVAQEFREGAESAKFRHREVLDKTPEQGAGGHGGAETDAGVDRQRPAEESSPGGPPKGEIHSRS